MSRSTQEYNQANWNPESNAFALRVGKVVAAHSEDHTIDAVLADGSMVFRAHLLTGAASTDGGDFWLPQFTPDPGVSRLGLPAEAWQSAPQEKRDCYCLIGYASANIANPFVLGFWFPEQSEMMIPGFQRLTRYVGDVYSGVSEAGDHWLAFDQAGAFVALHTPGNARPPDLTQQDYDRRHFSSRDTRSFTAALPNGASVSLDGEGGAARVASSTYVEIDALVQADISGGRVVVRGAEDLYLTSGRLLHSGQCLAPFSEDETLQALNLCVNCAHSRRLTAREGGAAREAVATAGWRFLDDGDAGRLEIGPDGRTRAFAATGGLRDGAIVWANPEPDYREHFVPMNFPTTGIQRWVVPPHRFVVTGVQSAGLAGVIYRHNGGVVGAPSVTSPWILAAGTVVEVEVTAIDGVTGAQLSFWGNRG